MNILAISDLYVPSGVMCPLNSEVIRRAHRRRLIGVCRSACENVDVKSSAERNIPIVSTPARNSVAVAEFTVALMIVERRNIARLHCSGRVREMWCAASATS